MLPSNMRSLTSGRACGNRCGATMLALAFAAMSATTACSPAETTGMGTGGSGWHGRQRHRRFGHGRPRWQRHRWQHVLGRLQRLGHGRFLRAAAAAPAPAAARARAALAPAAARARAAPAPAAVRALAARHRRQRGHGRPAPAAARALAALAPAAARARAALARATAAWRKRPACLPPGGDMPVCTDAPSATVPPLKRSAPINRVRGSGRSGRRRPRREQHLRHRPQERERLHVIERPGDGHAR